MLPGCRCTALHQLICFWLSFQVQTLTWLSLCQAEQQSVSPGPGVAAYRFMLEQNLGRTMLQFQVSSEQSSVLQSDLTSSHPVPKSTSIHQHCNALRRPDHHCVITSLLAAGADDGVPAAALERLPGRHAGAAVQPPGELSLVESGSRDHSPHL